MQGPLYTKWPAQRKQAANCTCDSGVLACTVASLASLPWTLGAHALTDTEAAGSGCLPQPAQGHDFRSLTYSGKERKQDKGVDQSVTPKAVLD